MKFLTNSLSRGICLSFAFAGAVLGHDGHDHAHEDSSHPVSLGFNHEVNTTVKGDYRYIDSNGIPDHKPGQFPNRGNPNSIRPQQHQFRISINPKLNEKPTALERQPFGVALNGVPFDPGTAEFWKNDRRSGWNYEALSGKINLGLDHSLAHVQPDGSYHYHGLPAGLIQTLRRDDHQEMLLVGYAADGFPIFAQNAHEVAEDPGSPLIKMTPSYRLRKGQRANGPGGRHDGTFTNDYEYVEGLGTLDRANGRFGVTPQAPNGTYYYVLTESFPHIPRYFMGTPDDSFERKGPPPGGPRGRRPPPRGPRPRF